MRVRVRKRGRDRARGRMRAGRAGTRAMAGTRALTGSPSAERATRRTGSAAEGADGLRLPARRRGRGRRTVRAAGSAVLVAGMAFGLAVAPACPSGTAEAVGPVPRAVAASAAGDGRGSASPAPASADAGGAGRGTASTSSAAPRWQWPVRPPHLITRPFSPPTTAYGPGHRGIDVAADPGAEVLAPADGTVSFAGVVVDRPVVSIRHADGLVSSVEPVVPAVSAGERVSTGQVIGTVAAEPRHEPDGGIHLGARLLGEYVDPALLLASLRHAVLLPLDP